MIQDCDVMQAWVI